MIQRPQPGCEVGSERHVLDVAALAACLLETMTSERILALAEAVVSLRLAPGKVTAVVGENEAGKSTVAKLLARFYDPAAGPVLVE